jgi:protein ImuB
LRGRPVIVYQPARSGVPTVVACSPPAWALGVRDGMPLAEATGLAGLSEALADHLLHHGDKLHGVCCARLSEPLADRRSLEGLAAWCQQFSPWVGLEDVPQPESLLLDLTGLTALAGDIQAAVGRIGQAFRQRGLTVRMALANTVGAAWALAHFGQPAIDGMRPTEGRGSGRHDRRIAEEIVFVVAERGFEDLQSLAVAALRLPPETIATLERLGIVEIGQLAALPRVELACRFGSELVTRIDQAAGTVEEVIQAYHAEPELLAQRALEFPTTRAKVLAALVKALLEQVAAKLNACGHGALQLACRFYGHSQPPATLTIGLFRPSAEVEHLWALVQMQLAQTRIDQPISKVSVEVTASAALGRFQKRLFDDCQAGCDPRQLATLVDRLTGRLGRQQVVRVRMVADAQPEYGFRSEPMAAGQNAAKQPDRSTVVGQRPLHLLPRPRPLEVVSVLSAGPPVQFPVAGRHYCLARYWGPERIETGWWRKDPVRRDYYRVETTTGHRFWLFRHLSDGAWFLHGVFA